MKEGIKMMLPINENDNKNINQNNEQNNTPNTQQVKRIEKVFTNQEISQVVSRLLKEIEHHKFDPKPLNNFLTDDVELEIDGQVASGRSDVEKTLEDYFEQFSVNMFMTTEFTSDVDSDYVAEFQTNFTSIHEPFIAPANVLDAYEEHIGVIFGQAELDEDGWKISNLTIDNKVIR